MNSDGIILVNGNVIMVNINHAAAAMFGYEVNDLLNKKFTLLLSPEESGYYDQYFVYRSSSNFMERANVKKIVSGLHSDGSTLIFRMSVSDVMMPNGQVHFLVFVENISVEREAEDVADLYTTLMNASPVPHVLCSSKGTITRLSRAAGETFQRNYHQMPPLLIGTTTTSGSTYAETKTITNNSNNSTHLNKSLLLQHLLPTRYGNPANVL